MNKNNIIRNPNRKIQAQLNKDQFGGGIQTEYDRMGIEPIKRGDFPKPTRNSQPSPRRGLVHEEQEPERVSIQGQDDFNKQVGIASGRKDQVWLPNLNEISDPNSQTFEYDEVFEQQYQAPEENQNSQGSKNDLLDVAPGQYVLCRVGQIIYVSDSQEEMEQIIDEIIFDKNYNIDLDDLQVFKCLPIKAGIVIRE